MYLLLLLGISSLCFALALTPVIGLAFRRLGVMDLPAGPRKMHRRAVPRVGGIAVLLSYFGAFLTILPAGDGDARYLDALHTVGKLAPALLIIFATGLLDDLISLKPAVKLAGQFAAAIAAYYNGVQIVALSGYGLPEWTNFPVTAIWLMACANAFNLIDGLDGLAAGVGIFAALTTLLAALTHQNLVLMLVTVPLIGALSGFLRYNFHPASIFLGDCGSLQIGFLLGCFAVLWSHKSATLLGMTAPVMALSVPLADVGLSVVRRYLSRRRIFGGDRRHIHHRLLDRGLTTPRAVLLIYGVCALAATFSLLQNAAPNRFGGAVVVLFCAASCLGVSTLGYSEFSAAGRVIFDGAFRRIVSAEVRLEQLRHELESAQTTEECWEAIRGANRELGFRGARFKSGGKIHQEFSAGPAGTCQLRVPLGPDSYLNLHFDAAKDRAPLLDAAYACLVQSVLSRRLLDAAPTPRTEIERETEDLGGAEVLRPEYEQSNNH